MRYVYALHIHKHVRTHHSDRRLRDNIEDREQVDFIITLQKNMMNSTVH